MTDFIRERVCFYSSMFRGRSSAWEIAEYAVKCGVAGVELMNFCDELRNPDMAVARELGAFIRSAKMTVPCFSAGINLVGEDRGEQLERLKKYADICAELGIPYLHHTISPGLSPDAVRGSFEDRFRTGVEFASCINEYAASLGVKTIVEDQGFVFNGVENYSRFVKETGGKIGTLLDVGNIMFVDERAEDFQRAFADSVCHVHIKDYIIRDTDDPTLKPYKTAGGKYLLDCEIGTGDINLTEVARGLADAGYSGFYSMEYSGVKDEDEVARTLSVVGRIFG